MNAFLDDEFDSINDSYAVFDDLKVDMADFEKARTNLRLGLELVLEFVELLNSLELSNEKNHRLYMR